jgi:hypothetical protein
VRRYQHTGSDRPLVVGIGCHRSLLIDYRVLRQKYDIRIELKDNGNISICEINALPVKCDIAELFICMWFYDMNLDCNGVDIFLILLLVAKTDVFTELQTTREFQSLDRHYLRS